MAAEINIRIDTQRLAGAAEQIDRNLQSVQTAMRNFDTVMKRLPGYWKGDASQQYQRYLTEQKTSIQEIYDKVKTYPGKLREIAGVEEQAERTTANANQGLPNDIL